MKLMSNFDIALQLLEIMRKYPYTPNTEQKTVKQVINTSQKTIDNVIVKDIFEKRK